MQHQTGVTKPPFGTIGMTISPALLLRADEVIE
jgi:hypothetical protein